jgi:hypothetical protein
MTNQYFRSINIPFITNQISANYNLCLPSGNIKNIQILSTGIHSTTQANGTLYNIQLNGLLEDPLYIHSSKETSFKDIFNGFIYTSPNITSNNLNVILNPVDITLDRGARTNLNLILYVLFIYE